MKAGNIKAENVNAKNINAKNKEAENIKEIRRGYFKYASVLIPCVAVFTVAAYCFLHTAGVEMRSMDVKMVDYDRIYSKQIEIAAKADSLYINVVQLGSNPTLNYQKMQSVISSGKISIISELGAIPDRDGRLYRNLFGKLNTFLAVKDSIRTLSDRQTLAKADLRRCLEDNRQASRRIAIGGIVVNNNAK